jgi:streptogramin lyase
MKLLSELAVAATLAAMLLSPASAATCNENACTRQLTGVVSSGGLTSGEPLKGAQVSVYLATGSRPVLLARTTTNRLGEFTVRLPKPQAASETRFAVASDGNIELMTVMSAGDRPRLRINEMTTVASAYAMAQFFDGKRISGKPLPLEVAASMFRNLAAPESGGVSNVLRRSPNADETNARRLMATLSNVLAGCVRKGARGNCAALFSATGGSKTTLEAIIAIARNPANRVREIFALASRETPFQPALLISQGPDAPNKLMRLDAFTVAVKVNRTSASDGPETCPFGGTGNLVFDHKGYAWITNNVVQGTPGSANCFAVLKPDGKPADGANGTPKSPLSGGGVLGQGFGITQDPSGNIWAGNFGWGGVNPIGSVSKFSPDGKALSPKAGFVSTLNRVQGTTSDQDGNIWIASYYGNAIQVFPAGDPSTDYPPYADSNTKPFHIVVDDAGAAYVSYTGTSKLSKLTYSRSGLRKVFTRPLGSDSNPKGIGLDTEGNVWATAGAESKIYAYDPDGKLIGAFSGGGITGPWGLSVDSHDNVWVANFGPSKQLDLKYRLSRLCGVNTAHCPDGLGTGDAISPETGYTLPSGGDQVLLANGEPLYAPETEPCFKPFMRATATQVDMAGNVWVTNNWKPSGLNDLTKNPGGDGMVIFVGLAAPVKPGIGQPKAP